MPKFGIWHTKHQKPCLERCVKCQIYLAFVFIILWSFTIKLCEVSLIQRLLVWQWHRQVSELCACSNFWPPWWASTFFFFLVKGNIHRQQSYPTPEVRPLQVFLTILTLQTPAKSELIKHKISALGGWLNTAKALFIEHPRLANASAGQFPSLKTCCTWTRWNSLSRHLQSHSRGE